MRRIQTGLGMMVLGVGMAAGQAAAPNTPSTPNTPNTPNTSNSSNAPAQAAAAAASPANGAAHAPAANGTDTPNAPLEQPHSFAFPEEDSKTKELPGAHVAPVLPSAEQVPDAPDANAPNRNAPAGANAHPYPGDSAPAGGYSSSSDTAAGNPDAGTAPDAPVRKKLTLEDAGSSGRVDTARADKDLNVADFYTKDGNYAGAYLRYKDAVTFDPEDADAHFGLAEMARKTGKPAAEAIAEYEAGLKLDPKNIHAKAARKALEELQAAAAAKK